MKKHIKVQAVVVDGFNKVLFKVLEQTHKGTDFGRYDVRDSRKFVASNGIVLASNQRPARDTDDKNIIWLQGNVVTKRGSAVSCTSDEWNKIAAAITEYNNYEFPVKPAYVAPPVARPRVQAAECGVIIG